VYAQKRGGYRKKKIEETLERDKNKKLQEKKNLKEKKRNNPKGRGAWHSTLYSLPPPLFINFLSSSSS